MQKYNTRQFHQQQTKSTFPLQNTPVVSVLPSPYLQNFRNRLNSFTSLYMTPINLGQSPMPTQISDPSDFFAFQLKPIEKETLEEFNLNNEQVQQKVQQKSIQKHQNDDSDSQQFLKDQGIINEQIKQYKLLFRSMIQIIINNLGISDKFIEMKKEELRDKKQLFKVFNILIKKLKKIKKTKQEMIKYCMRKAFKHIVQKIRKQTELKDNDQCLKYYFKEFEKDKTFVIPFKKNSINKTMNSQFLKTVFQVSSFAEDYKEFLKKFPAEIIKDNNKKLKVFVHFIDNCISINNIKRIQNYKRFPWTALILKKVQEVAKNLLLQHSDHQILVKISQIQNPEAQSQLDQKNQQKAKVKKNIILRSPPLVGQLNNFVKD